MSGQGLEPGVGDVIAHVDRHVVNQDRDGAGVGHRVVVRPQCVERHVTPVVHGGDHQGGLRSLVGGGSRPLDGRARRVGPGPRDEPQRRGERGSKRAEPAHPLRVTQLGGFPVRAEGDDAVDPGVPQMLEKCRDRRSKCAIVGKRCRNGWKYPSQPGNVHLAIVWTRHGWRITPIGAGSSRALHQAVTSCRRLPRCSLTNR